MAATDDLGGGVAMRSHQRILTAALSAAVLIAALAVLVGNMTASAAEVERVDVVLDFTGLIPGVTRTVTYPVDVPVDAQIVESGFISVTGIAEQIDWTIDLLLPKDTVQLGLTRARRGIQDAEAPRRSDRDSDLYVR